MLLIPVCLILGQATVPDPNSKNLDPKTRPYVELPLTKGRTFVSVSEHNLEDSKTKKKSTIRVYRFTYKAEYESEVKKWGRDYVKGAGWKLEESKPHWIIIGRPLKHPKIKEQALILHPGRIEFDANQAVRTKTLPLEKGWVWVSYNEILIRNK